MSELQVTKSEDVKKKIGGGEIVPLPDFEGGLPFVARLKKPSLMYLVKTGKIPNELLAIAQEVFEGKMNAEEVGNFKELINLFYCIAESALIEPRYKEIEEHLSDEQVMAIFTYTQEGIKALKSFREE